MKKYTRSASKNKKLLIVGAIFIVIVLLAIGFFVWRTSMHSTDDQTSGINPPNTVNYDPPTEEERQATEDHKKNLEEAQDTPPDNVEGHTAVTPVISYPTEGQTLSDVTINAFVPGITESNGVCAATLTQGASSITKTASSFRDATSTGCYPLDIARGEFPQGGQWTIEVKYTSPNAEGISQKRIITIE